MKAPRTYEGFATVCRMCTLEIARTVSKGEPVKKLSSLCKGCREHGQGSGSWGVRSPMRIICAWCKKMMGAKCPLCSSADIGLESNNSDSRCVCHKCGHTFRLNEAPPTHGICGECAVTVAPKEELLV